MTTNPTAAQQLRAAVADAAQAGDWVIVARWPRLVLRYTEHRLVSPAERERWDSPAYNRSLDLVVRRGPRGPRIRLTVRAAPWIRPLVVEPTLEQTLIMLYLPSVVWPVFHR
ncbi:hypothetical protein [Nocardia sp. IFM 10818]